MVVFWWRQGSELMLILFVVECAERSLDVMVVVRPLKLQAQVSDAMWNDRNLRSRAAGRPEWSWESGTESYPRPRHTTTTQLVDNDRLDNPMLVTLLL